MHRAITITAAGTARARRILLDRVRRHWVVGVLDRSLHREARIELAITVRTDDRRQPTGEPLPTARTVRDSRPTPDDSVRTPGGSEAVSVTPGDWGPMSRTLGDDTSIADLFTEFDRAVVILGAPGAGKTTLLLELARDLLDRAEVDPQAPIPVVADLASWAIHRQPIERWLVAQLTDRYGVPAEQAAAWVDDGQILPLFDGLDEVAGEHQKGCATAIAEFRRRRPSTPVAVCCRTDEYARLGAEIPVHAIVAIQPPTRAEIEDCLQRSGDAGAGLRAALDADPGLWEYVDSPFLLSAMALTYATGSAPTDDGAQPTDGAEADGGTQQALYGAGQAVEGTWPTSGGSGRSRILARYVDAMLERHPHPRYRPAQSRRYLAVLAADLNLRRQRVFSLDLLTESGARLSFPTAELVSRVAGSLAVAVLLGVAGALLVGWPGVLVGLATGLLALQVMSRLSLSYEDLDSISVPGAGGERQVDWVTGVARELTDLYREERMLVQFGLLAAMVVGFGFGLHNAADTVSAYALGSALSIMIMFGVTGTALRRLASHGHPASAMRREVPSPALLRRLAYALRAAPALGLVAGTVAGLPVLLWPASAPHAARYAGLVGLGSAAFLLLLAVGTPLTEQWLVRRRLARADLVPRPLLPFLDHAVQCLLLHEIGDGYVFVHRELLEFFASRQPAAAVEHTPATS